MNLTKEFFEKQFKKHDKVTIYSPENISLDISKVPYIHRDNTSTEFDLDCADLADYCRPSNPTIKKEPTMDKTVDTFALPNQWIDRCRTESWTAEMKEPAQQKALERSETHG